MSFSHLGAGLRSALAAGYGWADLRQDALAGLTVGIVAVPLAMALAIATGVPPQHGLYTAIIAGGLIALSGGSRFNVSGPTAAFVVILFPIVVEYGLGGLALATMMAGGVLVLLGLSGMGRMIKFVPYPVVLGFTAGIAVVIATRQLPDFLGLSTEPLGELYSENLWRIASAIPTLQPSELAIGALTLAVLLLWPRLRSPVPAPLAGLLIGAIAASLLDRWLGVGVATIDSRFSWQIGSEQGTGIPPFLPTLDWPWHLPGANGAPLVLDFALIRALIGPALVIAMLGAIESLLCAVVADGMTRTRHDADAELVGQGIGNLVVPFFGGVTATAALARTATSVRSGARSPIAAIVHALVVVLAVVGLAGVLGRLPMAALAALLFVVAWNMAEVRHFTHTLRGSPRDDLIILLTCFGLTVFFDMVLAVAVAVGIALAGALFIRRMALLTSTRRVGGESDTSLPEFSEAVVVYAIDGPLFFGAADRALTTLRVVDPGLRVVILDMRDVPNIDGTAIAALHSVVDEFAHEGIGLILVVRDARKVVKLRRAGIRTVLGRVTYCRDLDHARRVAAKWVAP